MKKNFKKLVATILAVVMLFATTTVGSFAADKEVMDAPTQSYYQFIERILGDFNIFDYTETLNEYVSQLNTAIGGEGDNLVERAKAIIEDYFPDQTIDLQENKNFYNKIKSTIVVIASDPTVNSNATKLVGQVQDFVEYLDKNKGNLNDTEIANKINSMALTINTALNAVSPYLEEENIKTYTQLQTKLDTAKEALKSGNTADKVNAIVQLVTDKGFQKVATNAVKTVVNTVRTTVQNTIKNTISRIFRFGR